MIAPAYQTYLESAAAIPCNHAPEQIRWRAEYMRHFYPRAGWRILDLGAYMGANCIHYALLGHRVEGVEGAYTYVRRFNEEAALLPPHIKGRIRFHHCMIEDFETEQPFDAVICGEVLEHVHNPEVIAAKAFECLRPGGVFFVGVFNRRLPTHKRECSPTWLCELLMDAGFEVQRVIGEIDHHIVQGGRPDGN